MKKIVVCTIQIILSVHIVANAQNQRSEKNEKPIIDFAALEKWSSVSSVHSPGISPSGDYITYSCFSGDPISASKLIIMNKSGSWKKEFTAAFNLHFSADNKQAVFQRVDSLCFLKLGSADPVHSVVGKSVKFSTNAELNALEWLAYRKKDTSVILLNLLNGEERPLGKPTDYLFDKSGKILLLKDTFLGTFAWRVLNLSDGKTYAIWQGKKGELPGNPQFDADSRRIAFTVSLGKEHRGCYSIWNYRLGNEHAELKLTYDDKRIGPDLVISDNIVFSRNGRWIFLKLIQQSQPLLKPVKDAVMLDVWSYNDRQIQPEQMAHKNELRSYQAVISSDSDIFLKLEHGDERMAFNTGDVSGNYVVMSYPDSTGWPDPRFNLRYPDKYYVLSLIDGSRHYLNRAAFKGSSDQMTFAFSFSPDERYLVYYSAIEEQWFSFEIVSGVIRNLTGNLKAPFNLGSDDGDNEPASFINGWVKKGDGVLLNDQKDLWLIDISGRHSAVNITNTYGADHHVKLRLLNESEWNYVSGRRCIYAIGDTLLFIGFNILNGESGFYRQILGKQRQLEQLNSGPFNFYKTVSQVAGIEVPITLNHGLRPLKAANANAWIVQRQSATEYPNYFFTNNFKKFYQLTDLAPQMEYNWLTAEMVHYKELDGMPGQGVLYKPENFDPKKKYPVILTYYRELSGRIYEFPRPEYSVGNINIPSLVSRGYLVFTPDIKFKPASTSNKTPGDWTCNSIIAAANYITTLPYVDGKRIGIQGHSFGGYETDYLVAHSHLFAAACAAAGVSDEISCYLNLRDEPSGLDELFYYELGQGFFDANMWQRPDLYISASPIFNAHKVTTPLLMVNNKEDDAVPWRQGIEMYMALRRLGKPSWLLQYDGVNHDFIGSPRESKDFTRRMDQFFDHYLKGYPPPYWMTRGIPAKLKGIDNGYELDTSGTCSSQCPICRNKDYSIYYDSFEFRQRTKSTTK